MGSQANEMVDLAVQAAIAGDVDLAQRVIDLDDVVDHADRRILNDAVVMIMQYSPVADDLRFLISTMGIVGEIEKVGDDAVKLAKRSRKLSRAFPTELRLALSELSDLSRKTFAGSMRLFCDYHPELAKKVIDADDEVDTAYGQVRKRIFDLIRSDPSETEHLVRCIEVFHALEHVADHAVAIATRMNMLYLPIHPSSP